MFKAFFDVGFVAVGGDGAFAGDEFEWIDARQLASIPEMIPAPEDYISNYRKANPGNEDIPQFTQLEVDSDKVDEEGNPIKVGATKQIELDVIVNIGEGLPNNKIALYNMVLSLSQIMLLDETTGQPRPLIGYKQFKIMVENYLGIKLSDNEEELDLKLLLQLAMKVEQECKQIRDNEKTTQILFN